jgi:hypothetical protein
MDQRWCQKVMRASIDRAPPTEAERAADAFLWDIAITKISQIGFDETALKLMQMAQAIAVPGRGGRPPGTGVYKRHELEALMQAVLVLDDGSLEGRRKAIAAVVQSKPAHHRPGLKVWLKRNLPQQHSSRADKTRT